MTGSGVGYLIFRKFSSTPAAGCAEPEDAPTTTASIRSLVLGPDLPLLAGLARCPGDRQASNSDRLDRSQVEIKASRDTTTGFITLDRASAKRILNALRLRPAAEKFKKCNGFGFSGTTTGRSCCVSHRAVGLFRACCRPVIVVFLTCFSRVPDSASEAVKPLNHHKKSTTSGPGRPKIHQKTAITRDFRLKAETSSLETACTASMQRIDIIG